MRPGIKESLLVAVGLVVGAVGNEIWSRVQASSRVEDAVDACMEFHVPPSELQACSEQVFLQLGGDNSVRLSVADEVNDALAAYGVRYPKDKRNDEGGVLDSLKGILDEKLEGVDFGSLEQ